MKGYVKISTYIITIVVLLIIFSVSTFFVISHYKKEQISENDPERQSCQETGLQSGSSYAVCRHGYFRES